jgi:D-apiose dehydrogenase
MNEPLRGAIIGCGFFGQIQLEAWQRIPEAEIVAACDTDLERALASAQRAYASATEMLEREQLDFVDIATRPDSHLPLVRLAAEHKVAVICQKPMAPDWEQAIAMVQTAEAAGIPFMIHENWRWQPWYREAHRRIRQGDIGLPISYCFRTRKRDGGGENPYPNQPYFSQMPRLLIYETLVHHIDTARFLFGEVELVYAQARRINPRIAGEDQALVLLTHEDGLQGIVDGHRFTDLVPDGPAIDDAVFEGEAGTLTVRNPGEIWLGAEKIWENPFHEGYRGDSVRAAQVHFVECLRTGRRFESGGREYLKTFGAVEAAYDSLARRCPVPNDRWKQADQ